MVNSFIGRRSAVVVNDCTGACKLDFEISRGYLKFNEISGKRNDI